MAPIDVNTLTAEIRGMAQVEMSELRKLVQFNWMTLQGLQAWEWGKPSPINATYTVIAMFKGEREIRAYGVPTKKGPYVCYLLSTEAPTYSVESMSLEVFKSEVADELSELAAEMDRRELGRLDEREDIVAWLRSAETIQNLGGDPGHTARIGDAIEKGVHADEEDEA